MKRFRSALAVFLVLAVCLCLGGGKGSIEKTVDARRVCADCNVILISVDDLRADHVGAYGYRFNTTPVMDDFAKEGFLFENTVSHSTWTFPSHSSMFTSSYSSLFYSGTKNNKLPESYVMLPEILKGRGYVTFGITDGTIVAPRYGLGQGYDTYGSQAKDAFRNATEFLKTVNGSRFFIFVHTVGPHCPYASRKGFDLFYTGPKANVTSYACRQQFVTNGYDDTPLADGDLERMQSLYDAKIRQADTGIGGLLAALEAGNLSNRTIVVITSDHGEEFMEHGHIGHGITLYDETLHVPLIMKSPTLDSPGGRSDRLAAVVDIVPTILDMLNVSAEGLEGVSLVPYVRGAGGSREIYGRLSAGINSDYHMYYMVRSERWKYIWDNITQTAQLYDLERDPQERKNLVEERADVAGPLKLKVLGWSEDNVKIAAGRVSEEVQLNEQEKEKMKSLGYAVG